MDPRVVGARSSESRILNGGPSRSSLPKPKQPTSRSLRHASSVLDPKEIIYTKVSSTSSVRYPNTFIVGELLGLSRSKHNSTLTSDK